jgi:hypothetical protein
MDTFPFYIALFIHLVSLIVGFGAVIVIDFAGFLWLLKKRRLDFIVRVARVTQPLIWAGWCGLVASGIVLITLKGYVDGLTILKLFFVAMLGLNGIFLHIIKQALERRAAHGENNLPFIWQYRVGLSSFISQLGWWGALTIGFVHRHWRHYIEWPRNPWAYIFAIAAFIFILALIGERLFAGKKRT